MQFGKVNSFLQSCRNAVTHSASLWDENTHPHTCVAVCPWAWGHVLMTFAQFLDFLTPSPNDCIFTQPHIPSFLTASAFKVPPSLCRHHMCMPPKTFDCGGGTCDETTTCFVSSVSASSGEQVDDRRRKRRDKTVFRVFHGCQMAIARF